MPLRIDSKLAVLCNHMIFPFFSFLEEEILLSERGSLSTMSIFQQLRYRAECRFSPLPTFLSLSESLPVIIPFAVLKTAYFLFDLKLVQNIQFTISIRSIQASARVLRV
jgi:hypothetical protein